MAVYYQQSGKRGEADFPKTIVDAAGNLRRFTTKVVAEKFGYEVDQREMSEVSEGGGFQIWGVPTGARKVLNELHAGDVFLLIGQLSPAFLEDGRFFYAGRVIFVPKKEDFEFSRVLWGDGGFPLIFFMQGALILYRWTEFTADFGMSPNYYVAGQTMKLAADRLLKSKYQTVGAFCNSLGIGDSAIRASHPRIWDN
jgi:hypothetical protein